MSDQKNETPIVKILLAANRHLNESVGKLGGALYFELAEKESHAPAVMEAHKQAVWAVKQLAIALEKLGVAGVCEKCGGSGMSIGMSHSQECDHCEKGLIYKEGHKGYRGSG